MNKTALIGFLVLTIIGIILSTGYVLLALGVSDPLPSFSEVQDLKELTPWLVTGLFCFIPVILVVIAYRILKRLKKSNFVQK